MIHRASDLPRPFAIASAAVVRDGRVLVIERRREPGLGLVSLPGGKIDVGETAEAAAHRELREEVGVVADRLGLAGHVDAFYHDSLGRLVYHGVVLAFAARWRAGEPSPSPEVARPLWLTPDELLGRSTTEGLAGIVGAALTIAERAACGGTC